MSENRVRDHERIEELVASRALGGLDPSDIDELLRLQADHGPDCAECRQLEDEYGEVAGRLAFAADPVEVPEGFEDRAAAAATASSRAEKRRATRGLRWFAAASAAAVLLIAGGVGGYLLRSPAPSVDLSQAGARVSTLAGSGQGTVALAYLPKSSQWYLVGSDLPDAPSGKVYELWLFHGKTPSPAGTFTPKNGVALLNVGSDASSASLAAVTIEDAPGAQQPTTQPIFAGNV
jgi:anti-sigma-K factor RskA